MHTQLVCECGIAELRIEIEDNVRPSGDLLVRSFRHARYLCLPAGQRLPVHGVACHDVAGTQYVSHPVQIHVDSVGEAREPFLDILGLFLGVIGDDEAVVLIGIEHHLPASSRSHDDHRVGHRRSAVSFRFELLQGHLDATTLNRQMGFAQYAHGHTGASVCLQGDGRDVMNAMIEIGERLVASCPGNRRIDAALVSA